MQCLNNADSDFGECENDCFIMTGGNSAYNGCVNACYSAQNSAYATCEYYHTNGDLAACQQQQNNANSFCEQGLTHCQIQCP